MQQVQQPFKKGCWYYDLFYAVEVGFPADQPFPIHEESESPQFGRPLPFLKTGSHLLAKWIGVLFTGEVLVGYCRE